MTYEIKYRREYEMKDSGIEWLGKVPEEWSLIANKYISHITTGGKDTQDSVENGKYPFYVRSATIERINSFSFDGEAILTPGDGDIGGIFHYAKGKFDFHQRVYKYSDFRNYNGKYLYYYLMIFLKNKVMSLSAKSTVDSIRRPMLLNFKCLKTKLSEQEKIANFLDLKTAEFDSIISKKEDLIEKLEEAKKSLISEVVTGKVKIVDGQLVERKSDEMKDSGVEWLGMIPKEWEAKKIKYISKLNNKTLSNNNNKNLAISYIDIASVDNTGNINEIQELIYLDAPSRAKRIVFYEDTIVSTVRTYLKAIAFIDERYDEFICSTGFAVFTPIKKLINPKYFYYVINSEEYINQIVSRSTGVSYPAINASEISNLNFILPKLQEQDLIVEILEYRFKRINSIITKTKEQIQKLKEAKQSLISEAVTGRIDLKDWVIREI